MAIEQQKTTTPEIAEAFSLKPIRLGQGGAKLTGLGPLQLPPQFNPNKFSSKYVYAEDVPAFTIDRPMAGIPFMEPAWIVWEDKDKKRHEPAFAGRKMVLLYRPIEQTRSVEKAYAEFSRSMLENKKPTEDLVSHSSGMLGERDLGEQ